MKATTPTPTPTTTTTPLPEAGLAPARVPRIWGLSPRELHDAFWRSKGVQCIRRGQRTKLQRAADLFLLIEPDQLVMFNIAQISERLTWHSAKVTRLRLLDEGEQRYSEHVVINRGGLVQRIERRYRPPVQGTSRVVLASTRRAASIWMSARTRREAWDRIRRSVPWVAVDHWKCAGVALNQANPGHLDRMLNELVAHWRRPDQSISGLEEVDAGVWHIAGESIRGGVVRIGPVWLGRGDDGGDQPCLIGPAWTLDKVDDAAEAPTATVLRSIADIEVPDQVAIHAQNAPGAYPALKRLFDIVGSLAALIVLLPVMVLVAACIIAESGRPLFFGHRRQGRGGRLFRCWKFRTMHRDAEKIARAFQHVNRADGPQVLIPNDPRVTRVGRILRATNLDELPQFWNVLVGQMSLVGPRPSPDDENQFCPAWRDLRLSVRPGITGLWQLYRTREPGEDFQEWIKYDIQYVQSASFLLDLRILVQTARMLLLKWRPRHGEGVVASK